jgi:hypothetical protein
MHHIFLGTTCVALFCQRNLTPSHPLHLPRRRQSNIIISFIPGGCTGVWQPLDVGIHNRPNVDHILLSDFLEGQWGLDILSQEGLNKMKEIVTYIQAEAADVMGQ